jgi:hypothetical protein
MRRQPIMVVAQGLARPRVHQISGPCYVGRHVTVLGGDVTGSSIGDCTRKVLAS